MPAPIWARSPITAASSTVPAPMRAPNPTTLSRTTAPAAICGAVEDHRTVDDRAGADRRTRRRSWCRRAASRRRRPRRPVSTSASPVGPGQRARRGEPAHQVGRAGDEVGRRAEVAPVAGVDEADHPRARRPAGPGNVSRSTDTGRPAGIDSSTSRRNT